MSFLRPRLAESMIESMIAVTVIVLSSAAAMSMLRSSIQGNNVIGEKLVAIELGLEALDAIENIRDTNYLLFSSEADDCWNALGASVSADCSGTIADNGAYYLLQNFAETPYYHWNLIPISSSSDGRMHLFELTSSGITLYSDSHNASAEGFRTLETNAFVRRVLIDYQDEDGMDLCPDALCFKATVTVQWNVNSLPQELSLSRIISHLY